MHAAPAVSVPCGRRGVWRVVHAVLPALAVAALAAWALGHAQRPVWPAVSLTIPLGWWAWKLARPAPLVLAWDGEQWSADGNAGRLDVMIDLGTWMLLRLRPLQPDAGAVWIPVTRSEAGPAFHALRVAAYARLPAPPKQAAPADASAARTP